MSRGSTAIPGERRGFTLVELVVGLAVTTVLLGAMGSLIVMASRIVPDKTRATDLAMSGAAVLDQMTADLAQATSIIQGTDTSIEFTVPDRNGDSVPEDICYTWPTPGGDLFRIVNGGLKISMARSVSAFSLSYSVVGASTSIASSITNIAETQAAVWPSGGLGLIGSLSLTAAPIDSSKMIAQNIRATLPSGARSWTITHVQVCAKADLLGTPGTMLVQIRTTDATGAPTGTVLASAALNESAFSSLAFSIGDAVFSFAPALAPNQEVAIVVSCGSGCPSGSVGYASLSTARSTPMWLNSGSGWTSSTLQAMPFAVYATETTSAPGSTNAKKLGQVNIQLRVGTSSSADVRTTVNILNTPGVS